MKYVITMLVACLLPFQAHAQSLALQAAALHNDKLQKAYLPYRLALQGEVGSEVAKSLMPTLERRRVCQWEGVWNECGYFRVHAPNGLMPEHRAAILEILKDPCARIVFSRQGPDRAIEAGSNPPSSSMRELERLCKARAFRADSVRIAVPNNRMLPNEEPDASKHHFAFEARILRPNQTK
jgi:hypothetical protein